jgi:hypothetical protein
MRGMGGWRTGQMGRTGQVRWIARGLSAAGVALLLAGALVGWLAPRLPDGLVFGAAAQSLIHDAQIDVSGYLGADITALAVIIAVVIGFNATTLQIAGQTHSLALVRAILLSLTPFLLTWTLTTGVALIYFLLPPVYVTQLWQMLCWFGAVVLLMIAYLWDLPWRLSGQYVGLWAIRGLARVPIGQWEALDGYSTLQTAVAAASARGDLGTVRAVTAVLGRFLADVRDAKAEAKPTYDRARYRALKNLLTGCAQNAAGAPNAVVYNLGAVAAGVTLQAAAVGHPSHDPDHDLYSGLLGVLHGNPQRLDPLWTGMRHALCREFAHGDPFLIQYWRTHARWPADDPRRIAHVAGGLAFFHASCRSELREVWSRDEADAEAADMAADLYRDIVTHLSKQMTQARPKIGAVRLADVPLSFLDTVHAAILNAWPAGEAESERVVVVNAYESRRAELIATAAH